jgi:uncharacterized protein YkwD
MKSILVAALLSLGAFNAAAADPSNEITPENVVALFNAYRAEAGFPPLHLDARMARAAEARMRDMEDGAWWSHESPEGTSPFVWLAAEDYRYAAAAENLAAGFETARLLVQSWMESPGHRANIMNVQYADCGIAIIDGRTSGPATGKSIIVLFGRPMVEMIGRNEQH